MSEKPRSGLPADPKAAIDLLQAELAETNREVMLLTLEMEKRVEARTAEAKQAREQLEKSNAELVELTRDLERRVAERTEALSASEERYRLAAEGLEAEAHRKDEFLALLGHELRNPLAPIRTAIHLLRSTESGDPTTARIHDTIDRQVTHLARLVDDLLDVSRIARGKVRLQKEPLDLVQLVRLAAEDHRHELESARLAFSVQVPERDVWVNGDATRLSQIVGNLLNNARKFTDPGGRVTLRLVVDDRAAAAVLSVSDTGIGIEPEIVPTLFEPFSQSERVRTRAGAGGLGLGLALVKGLTDLHDGTAKVESAGVGKGATVTVRLPLIAAGVRREPARDLSPGHQRRILIVEDNRDAATTLALFLEGAGHEVAQAPDVASALQTARTFQPQIILSDIGLPGGMDGYDLARTVRSDPGFGTPYLVAITGFGQETDRQRAREAGFDLHLIKPVDPHTLERALARLPLYGTRTER